MRQHTTMNFITVSIIGYAQGGIITLILKQQKKCVQDVEKQECQND